jgi:signal transduction histidine kinase/ActR/RegA family two-component response regulator
LTPLEFRPSAERATEQLRTTGVATPWETETYRKDGSRVHVLVGVAMLDYPKCIAFLADLTERKQAEAGQLRAENALRQSEEQLRQAQKMEAVGRLAGGVAHDFNNVLSVILSYSELILADLKPNDPMRDDVGEIRKAASRAAGLTRQLLMFSRQQVVEPKVLDLYEALTSMDKMLRRIVGEDVELALIAPKTHGRVKVDPSHIEQVILNLVVNARDAMPTGGKLTIEISNVVLDEEYALRHLPVKPGPHVMMAVSDTGCGMSRDTQARIFEPFFTTKEMGKGTGLGLSTVFGIVQQSGGNIWVYSEVGKGTTFKVYLPRVDAEVDPLKAQATPTTLRGTETILLVEDEEQVRAVALSALRRQGYHVLVAQHAGEALLLCESHPESIDLLLTDVVMPQMSGPELARRLARSRPEMKVLCMSGYTDDSIVRHGVLDIGVAFIQKPITPALLARKVREVLDNDRTANSKAPHVS